MRRWKNERNIYFQTTEPVVAELIKYKGLMKWHELFFEAFDEKYGTKILELHKESQISEDEMEKK